MDKAIDWGNKAAHGDTDAATKLVLGIGAVVLVVAFMFALVAGAARNAGQSLREMLTGTASQATTQAQGSNSDYGTNGGGI